MEMDIAFQSEIKALELRIPHLVRAEMMGGSGLQLSKLLRTYFLEYAERFVKHGPHSFPTSFNVVESFMSFIPADMLFHLREEAEHLLSINDYFRWYESNEIPREPRILEDILTEGKIYSYEMVSDASSFRICGDSQQVFAAVGFVRHDYELSCLLLAGEDPPLRPDKDVPRLHGSATLGKEKIVAHPDYTSRDRYLEGYPTFAKVIVLSRFDLHAAKHDVRYINLDNGPSFEVLTDDASMFDDIPPNRRESYRATALSGLERYNDLFAALASMIYLPAFFAAFPKSIHELEVATELDAVRDEKDIRQTIKELGNSRCILRRVIRCFPIAGELDAARQISIEPPQMEFKCDGYWKAINPQEVGEDKTGIKIFGRTWVSRHESWSAQSPQSFILRQPDSEPGGTNPGVIYIQRSPALEPNLYKIGSTKRDAKNRATELSSATGVPLPFGVLASWSVRDCDLVEHEVHQKLAAFRINPRREFFRAELSIIVRTIEDIVKCESSSR